MPRKEQKPLLAARKAEWVAARRALLAHELLFALGFLSDTGYKKRLAHVVWLSVFCSATEFALSFQWGNGPLWNGGLLVCKLGVLLVAVSCWVAIVSSLSGKALTRWRAIAQLKANLGNKQLPISLENRLLFLHQDEWVAKLHELFARGRSDQEAFELHNIVAKTASGPRLGFLGLARNAAAILRLRSTRRLAEPSLAGDALASPTDRPQNANSLSDSIATLNGGESASPKRSSGPRRL